MPLLSKDVRAIGAGDLVRVDAHARKVVRVRAVSVPCLMPGGGRTETPGVEILHGRADCPGQLGYFTAPEGAQVFVFIP